MARIEWAGSITDAMSSLYSSRYDLVIFDLRLPEGSGLELLRDATEEGLLAHTAAIILTGHEFEEPDDIRVFHKPLEIGPFLDRMGVIISAAKQRRHYARTNAPVPARAASHDRGRPPGNSAKIELVLYVSASSEKCKKALHD